MRHALSAHLCSGAANRQPQTGSPSAEIWPATPLEVPEAACERRCRGGTGARSPPGILRLSGGCGLPSSSLQRPGLGKIVNQPLMRARAFLVLLPLLGPSCSSDPCAKQAPALKEPLDCVSALPSTQGDGTPWPTYDEKLAEFQACRDGSASLYATRVATSDCDDGKKLLTVNGGVQGESYYYQDEALVGYYGWTTTPFVDCSGCAFHPLGTRDGVTCNVLRSTAFNCGGFPDAGSVSAGSIDAGSIDAGSADAASL
jgi:hypothetical protein